LSATGTGRKAGGGNVGRGSPRRTKSVAARPNISRVGRKRRRLSWKARAIIACATAVVLLLAWATIARALAPAGNTAQEQFDVLIVLGYPADADGNPTPTELARVTEAVNEYERGVAPKIIITGGPAHNQFVEAEVMARVAEAQGIPAGAIVLEPQARDTIQNACDSLRIMQRHGWESAEVVSSASHLPRAGLILSGLPLKWRTHAAPALEPEEPWMQAALTAVEIAKTARYLVWSRQMESCRL
jgi:uncharacterized SAM-binding protein YcdF (DUF218 family)